MNKSFKKTMSFLLVFTLFIGLIPVTASASEEIIDQAETYTYQRSGAENLLTQSSDKSHAFSPFDNQNAEKTAREDAEYSKNVIIYERTFTGDTRLFSIGGSGVDDALAQLGAANTEEIIMNNVSSSGDKMMSLGGTVKTVYRAKISADVWEAVDTLLAFDEITYAEPEYLYHTAESGLPGTADTANQWYIDNGPFRAGWEYMEANHTGEDKAPGEGSVVAVIDTGVDYSHPDLISNMWINSGEIPDNGVDDDGNGYADDYYGYNFIANTGDPMDDHGHGTHVAGIIGMGDNGYGGVGAAYGAQIMAIKAGQSTGVFSSTDIAKAINYAKTMGADVINMSFGGYSTSTLVENALQSAFSSCVLVAAAGNDGIPTSDAPAEFMKKGDMYPASYSYVIGVMATDSTGNLAGFSNWDYYNNANAEYELTAPGANIYTTLPGGRYASWDGTSMAAPMIAAAAAIMRSYYPDKNTYSSRFIMGQLTSATEDSIYYVDKIDEPHTYAALDLTDSLSKLPKPNLSVTEVFALDTIGLNALNDGDGIVDAGEIIDLGLTVRNQWGAAKNVTVTIDAISDGGVANPYITLITDTISLGTVGTFSSVNNGYVYNDGYLENVTIPLRFKISDICPNDANIAINITVTANNGWDIADITTYTASVTFSIWVQRGRALKGEISVNTTLSNDYYWIIESGVLITEGVTLTVEPGTQIQFWSSDYEDAYGSMTMAYINNMGTLNMIGTEDEPIEMFPGKNFESFCVNIYGDGVETLTYCNIINPILGIYGYYMYSMSPLNFCDHVYMLQNINDINYRHIENGNIRQNFSRTFCCRVFNIKNSIVSGLYMSVSSSPTTFITDYSENVLFVDCSINLTGNTNNCVYLGNHNNKNNSFTINDFSGIQTENPTYSDIYTYNGADSKYVFMDYGEYTIKRPFAEALAASLGGTLACINNINEENYIFDTLYERAEETRIDGDDNTEIIYGTYLGYTYNEELGINVWTDGNNYTFSQSIIQRSSESSLPFGVATVISNPTNYIKEIRFASSSYYGNISYLLEFPANLDDIEIKSALDNFRYNDFKKDFYKPMTNNCAVLNPMLDTDTSKWMYFTAPNYIANCFYNLSGNYWGTENSNLINLMIKDADDYAGILADIDETPILTHDSPKLESIYPFVKNIWLEDDDGNVIDSTSYQNVNVHVTYNRDMDISVQPIITYGPAEPYTDFAVNGNWVSSREWVGTTKITAFTGDGTQYFRAAGGCAADDSWLVCGKDTMRFDFTVVSTGAESLNLNGTASESGLKLYWNQDEYDTLAGFNIYRSTSEDGTYVKLNTTLLSSSLREYTDTDVTSGTAYYYYFTVVNTDFTESRASNIVSLTAFDNIAPVLSHTPVTTVKSGQACSFTASASDNISVESVKIYYRETGKTNYTDLEMSATGNGSNYFASIPANQITAAGIEYYIEATDGTSIARSGSPAVPYVIAVDFSPSLYSVSPYYLSVAGGETATLIGLNFTEGMTVKLGGSAIDYTYVSSTKFTFVTPAKSMGRYDLEISGPNGTAKLLNAVSYTDSGSEGQIGSATAVAGSTTKIPIYATISGGISSVELYVKLNTSLFSSVAFEKAEGTSGFSLSYNNLGSGVYKLAMASSDAYTAGSAIAYLTVVPNSTDMTVSTQAELQSLIINGTEVDSTFNGEIIIKPAFTLTGKVTYAAAAVPVSNVLVSIAGGPGGTSDANGDYTVSNITSANVTYSASKSGDAGDYAVSSLDASYVLQYCVESLELSETQLLAADVDGDGDADAQDASFILQKAVGKIDGVFPGSGKEWAFEPPFKNTILTSVTTTQNFTAVLLGDVTGNWASIDNEETSSMSAYVGEPLTAIQSGIDSITYPLSVNINDAYGIDIIIALDDGVDSVGIEKASVLNSASVDYNVSENELKISIASTDPISFNGEYLRIVLTPEAGKILDKPPCTVIRILVNENEVLLDNGIINADILFNFQGVAIKLIEPWGLRFYTQVSGEDFNSSLSFGTIVLHQNYYTAGMTAEEMMADPNAIILTSESGDSVLDSSSRIVSTMVGGIYTYTMNTSFYTAAYVVINGEYIFSPVNSRNIYDRVVYLKDNSTDIYVKPIYQEMYNLYTDVKSYHDSLGTVTIPEPETIKRGSECSPGTVAVNTGLVSYVFKGVAIRLIEPWGLCFYTEMTTADMNSVTEFGTVVLSENDYAAGMTGEEMRMSDNSYVFNSADGTAVYDSSNRIVAKLVESIYTYNMDKIFYTVSYAVIGGEYYYSGVNSRNMYDRVTLLKDTSTNVYVKEIYASMFNLYGAVDVYHRSLGLKQ